MEKEHLNLLKEKCNCDLCSGKFTSEELEEAKQDHLNKQMETTIEFIDKTILEQNLSSIEENTKKVMATIIVNAYNSGISEGVTNGVRIGIEMAATLSNLASPKSNPSVPKFGDTNDDIYKN